MLYRQTFPSLRRTSSGRSIAAVLGAVAVLHLLFPEARPGLAASAPILIALLPAALAGILCRVGCDLLGGRDFAERREPWLPLGGALGSLLGAAWLAGQGWHLVETAQPASGTWEGVLTLLLPLAALGTAGVAARAGYLDGAEPTWRVCLQDLARREDTDFTGHPG